MHVVFTYYLVVLVFFSMIRKIRCLQTNFGLTSNQETTKLNVNEFIFELKTTKF